MKDKYCLDSIVPFKTINEAQTNTSRTKQAFSFSRSNRFDSSATYCPVNSYNGQPISPRHQGAGIGYGTKADWTKILEFSPTSTRYNMRSLFDSNKINNKGHSLGGSRNTITFDSYIDQQKLKNPGIGKYQVQKDSPNISNRAPAFSLRTRTKVHDLTQTIQSQNENPSPAHYENNPELSDSLYSSHFKKISFSQNKAKRFANPDNKVPGPLDYDNSTSLSNVGKYVMSGHKGGTNAKFDNQARKTKFDHAVSKGRTLPGPGWYKMPSQFGQYDGEVYAESK